MPSRVVPWVSVYSLNVFTLWIVICSSLQWAWKGHFNKQLAISKQAYPPTKVRLHLKQISCKHTNKLARCTHTQARKYSLYWLFHRMASLRAYFNAGLSIIIKANTNKHNYSRAIKASGWNSPWAVIESKTNSIWNSFPHICIRPCIIQLYGWEVSY